uniref:NADH-ubiquinone oxidoreductase chain 1 n=1 Tax=Episcapha fortunii TaxID=2819887 RepID=A0A977Q706_9CUCU|nr:NADH dehydrogenase subunit 1 [Episcapha fortunii]UXF64396.1 NADH dehydrogenase subunit 1 [Episcapha fortunii]
MILEDLVLLIFGIFIMVVCVLVSVAFLTLMERKILGYIQIRKGPNKVGFMGILQPFSDAIKLFSKEQTFPLMSNLNLYYLSPLINLFLALLLWVCIPLATMNLTFEFSFLFFLSVSSLGVYTIMLAGWSSNSNYSMLGSMRAVAQTISYEVSLILLLMSFLFLIISFNIIDLFKFQEYIWFLFLCFPLCLMWLVTSLAETNRTPFDFAEGESELVSGFNVEYSSGGFAMIFLSEYANILFMSLMCSLLFLGSMLMTLMFFMKMIFMVMFWVWTRGTLPRYRYDKLMNLAWKSYLPVSLNYMMFFYMISMMVFIFYI